MALVVAMLAASIAISSTVEVVAVGTSWLGLASAAGLGISVAWPGFERELAAYLRDPRSGSETPSTIASGPIPQPDPRPARDVRREPLSGIRSSNTPESEGRTV